MTWVTYGPQALLFRFAEQPDEVAFNRSRSLVAWLERAPPPGLVEFIPAFTSILLEFDPQRVPEPQRLGPELAKQIAAASTVVVPPAPVIEIPVQYDGPDLGRVAAAHAFSPRRVVELHIAPVYWVAMIGFSPGFAYLGGLDERLHTPRLDSPRPQVPAGAVGIGGQHTGIYSVPTPGGWNLIGRTPVKLLDRSRRQEARGEEAMFLLRHGDRVRFVPLGHP